MLFIRTGPDWKIPREVLPRLVHAASSTASISKSYCDTGSCAASHLNSLKQLHLQTCCIVLTRIRVQKRQQLSVASTLKGPIMPNTLDTCYSTAALKSFSFVGRSPLMACAEISNAIHSNSHLIVCRSTRYPLSQAKLSLITLCGLVMIFYFTYCTLWEFELN